MIKSLILPIRVLVDMYRLIDINVEQLFDMSLLIRYSLLLSLVLAAMATTHTTHADAQALTSITVAEIPGEPRKAKWTFTFGTDKGVPLDSSRQADNVQLTDFIDGNDDINTVFTNLRGGILLRNIAGVDYYNTILVDSEIPSEENGTITVEIQFRNGIRLGSQTGFFAPVATAADLEVPSGQGASFTPSPTPPPTPPPTPTPTPFNGPTIMSIQRPPNVSPLPYSDARWVIEFDERVRIGGIVDTSTGLITGDSIFAPLTASTSAEAEDVTGRAFTLRRCSLDPDTSCSTTGEDGGGRTTLWNAHYRVYTTDVRRIGGVNYGTKFIYQIRGLSGFTATNRFQLIATDAFSVMNQAGEVLTIDDFPDTGPTSRNMIQTATRIGGSNDAVRRATIAPNVFPVEYDTGTDLITVKVFFTHNVTNVTPANFTLTSSGATSSPKFGAATELRALTNGNPVYIFTVPVTENADAVNPQTITVNWNPGTNHTASVGGVTGRPFSFTSGTQVATGTTTIDQVDPPPPPEVIPNQPIFVAADGRTITYRVTDQRQSFTPSIADFHITVTTAGTAALDEDTIAGGTINQNVGAEFINPTNRTSAPVPTRSGNDWVVTAYSTGVVPSDISIGYLEANSRVKTVRVQNDIGTPQYLFALDPTLTPDDSGDAGAHENEGFRVVSGTNTTSWHLSYTPLGSDGVPLAISRGSTVTANHLFSVVNSNVKLPDDFASSGARNFNVGVPITVPIAPINAGNFSIYRNDQYVVNCSSCSSCD